MSSKTRTHRDDKTGSWRQVPFDTEHTAIRAHQQPYPATVVHHPIFTSELVASAQVLQLQRILGNRAVGSLLQAKALASALTPLAQCATPTAAASGALSTAIPIQRQLIFEGKKIERAEDLSEHLGDDFEEMADTIQVLIDLPGQRAVNVDERELREVHAGIEEGRLPSTVGAKVASCSCSHTAPGRRQRSWGVVRNQRWMFLTHRFQWRT